MAFHCTVVTPDQQMFDGGLKGAIVPAHDGMIGIETGRSPILMRLGVGLLTLHKAEGGDYTLFIDGGVAQMKDNVLTIITDSAKDPSTLKVDDARATLKQLESPGNLDELAFASRDRKLRRARAVLRVKGAAE